MTYHRFLAALGIVLFSTGAFAQDDTTYTEKWQFSLITDITTTQTSYSDDWVGGEEGSVNWVTNTNGTAEKNFSPKFRLKSNLRLAFGQTVTQNSETRDWGKAKKTTDLIDWETVGTFKFGWVVDPYGAFRLESQFYDGTVPEKKIFLRPLKLTESAGIARTLYKRPKNEVTSRLGFGVRQIFRSHAVLEVDTSSQAIPIYNTKDSTFNDGGFESVTDAKLQLSERLQYIGKLSLFKAVFFSESDVDTTSAWKTIDVYER